MIIRSKALELIAVQMGEHSSGTDLVNFLKDQGVPNEIIEYPQTKWRMILSVMNKLSNSNNLLDHYILKKIITSFVHPLNMGGDEKKSLETIKQWNQFLKFDSLEIVYSNNDIQIVDHKKTEEEKHWEEGQILSDTEEAINIIKTNYLNDLITLKKGYQLIINIVETTLENPLQPNERLNEAYLKLCKITENAKNKIFDALEVSELNMAEVGGYKFYKPFKNLYSIEAGRLNETPHPSLESFKAKMNSYFGEVVQLCLDCNAGDILDVTEVQKLFNEVSLYLTKLREKNNKLSDLKQVTRVQNFNDFKLTETTWHVVSQIWKVYENGSRPDTVSVPFDPKAPKDRSFDSMDSVFSQLQNIGCFLEWNRNDTEYNVINIDHRLFSKIYNDFLLETKKLQYEKISASLEQARINLEATQKTTLTKTEATELTNYKITYESRDILLNGNLIARPNFNGENDLVFNFLISNPNEKFTRKEIETKIKTRLKKTFHKIVDNLGFTGNLRKLFFNISSNTIQFNNPIVTTIKL